MTKSPAPPPKTTKAASLTASQQAILDTLSNDATNVDIICERTEFDAGLVLRDLTFLSLKAWSAGMTAGVLPGQGEPMRVSDFVCVYVVRPAGGSYELLLGLRSSGRYLSGVWSLITGGIEPNETAWQAAIREVQEEAGLTTTELYRLSTLTQFYRNDIDAICLAPMFCMIMSADAETIINPEHTQLKWVPIDQAAARLLWPTDLAGLAEVRHQILGDGPAKRHLRIPLPD